VATIVGSENEYPKVIFVEGAAPGTPPSGFLYAYAKSDGKLYYKDDGGTEHGPLEAADLSAHTGDTTDAHDASAISAVSSGYGNSSGTDVQTILDDFDAAITAASGGGGSTDLTIPSGGTLYDGTSSSGWSAFGSPDTFDVDTTKPDHFYLLKGTSGGNNIYGATHAVGGSFPRTYTCRVTDALQVANYQGVGLVLGDSGGKFMSWGTIYDAGDYYLQRYLWNSASSAGANVNYLSGATLRPAYLLPIFLRLVVNSTSNIDLQWSRGGMIYHTLASAVNPSMTVDRFGLFVYGFGARAEGAIKWVHES